MLQVQVVYMYHSTGRYLYRYHIHVVYYGTSKYMLIYGTCAGAGYSRLVPSRYTHTHDIYLLQVGTGVLHVHYFDQNVEYMYVVRTRSTYLFIYLYFTFLMNRRTRFCVDMDPFTTVERVLHLNPMSYYSRNWMNHVLNPCF